jgi:hypothetical protein
MRSLTPLWLSRPLLSIPKCRVHTPAVNILAADLIGLGGELGNLYIVINTDEIETKARLVRVYEDIEPGSVRDID